MKIYTGLWFVLLILVVQPAFAQTEALPRGERILCIDLNEAQGVDYQEAFDLALSVGNQNVNLSFDWRDLEATPGTIASDIFPIINLFYPVYDMPVSLFIRPISTGLKVVPADLVDVAFDEPQMIARFEAIVDYVFAQTPDTSVTTLIIGSEIDAYLGSDARLWAQYTTFFREIRDYIKADHPDVLVATEGLFVGMTGDARRYFDEIQQYADVVGVSYYPTQPDFSVRAPDAVHEDFARLVELYGAKPIHIFQLGYPSSEVLNSSEEMQAQFVREVFAAWDEQAAHILFIKFTWMHDISPETLAGFEAYYSYSAEEFVAFLSTLGLRTYEGEDKLAWTALQEEAQARGWGT
ncbi:MAG: hypothetical protein U0694_04670 [Anaerolineae bacterium]